MNRSGKFAHAKYDLLAVLLVFLALLANCTSVSAIDYEKVGVKVGDTVEYETSLTGSDVNRTHILVYGIVGTVVFLNFTRYYPNGTVDSEFQMTGDVFNGAGSVFFMLYLLAANLTMGNPVFLGSNMMINETVIMTFAGTLRTVNHLSLPDILLDVYWDKATGLMTKLNYCFIGWINMTLISTDAWSIVTPPPPVAPTLSVELSGEFDYSIFESIYVKLAALVRDVDTLCPVSNATVIIEIYYPNGTLWISGKMSEKLVGTGIYEWQSYDKIVSMKLKKGVYLVHARAFVGIDPQASDMLLFHVDPPSEGEDSVSMTILYSVTSATVLAVGAVVGIFLIRRHNRLQSETLSATKPLHAK